MPHRLFDDIRKDAVAADAHVATALGNEGGKRRGRARLFRTFLAGGPRPVAPVEIATAKQGARALHALDAEHSYTPFPFDPHAMASLRPDQTPRFLGALTNPELLEDRDVPLDSLTAMQNRVDTAKVTALAGKPSEGKPPVVIRANGKHYIADGHHRLTAAWLRGESAARAKFKDLEPVSNAMKGAWSVSVPIVKTDEEMRVAYGWASVIEDGGQVVTDLQGDRIAVADMVKAAHDFVASSRTGGLMHWEGARGGEIVESMVLTPDVQKALGIDIGKVGWFIGYRCGPEVWPLVKDGTLKAFSIGGRGLRVPIDG